MRNYLLLAAPLILLILYGLALHYVPEYRVLISL